MCCVDGFRVELADQTQGGESWHAGVDQTPEEEAGSSAEVEGALVDGNHLFALAGEEHLDKGE